MTPANDNRPREFDARLMAHLPMLRALIARYCHPNERDEVLQDVFADALANWQKFRPEGSFHRWLMFRLLNATKDRRRRDRLRGLTVANDNSPQVRGLSVAPTQDDSADLAKLVSVLSETRGGKMLLRLAQGEMLHEIGETEGLSKERVRQLTVRARSSIAKFAA